MEVSSNVCIADQACNETQTAIEEEEEEDGCNERY